MHNSFSADFGLSFLSRATTYLARAAGSASQLSDREMEGSRERQREMEGGRDREIEGGRDREMKGGRNREMEGVLQ